MTDIKRYVWKECDAHACRCDLVESASGDWVDYDDHIAALSQRDAQIAALTAENLDLKHPGTYLPSKRETPATDAAANALRADGAIAARNALVVAGDGSDIYATVTAVIEQLREGK